MDISKTVGPRLEMENGSENSSTDQAAKGNEVETNCKTRVHRCVAGLDERRKEEGERPAEAECELYATNLVSVCMIPSGMIVCLQAPWR